MKMCFLTKAGIFALVMNGAAQANAQVGINTESPSNQGLHILQKDQTTKGQAFRLEDGNEGMGKVLMTDEDGNGTWVKINVPVTVSITTQPKEFS